jgi:prepilin-type N-terminal cleavage/methylation domain-containing protein
MSRFQPGCRSARSGLSLAEVLATIAIIAIVVPVTMQGVSIASSLAGLTRQRAEAVSLAETKLNELLISGDWQTSALAGDFGLDWPGYQWRAQVSNWEEPDMQLLEVVVRWQARGREREVKLDTLVYVAAESL